MQPTKELIDQLYRERVLRARRMPMDLKFALGAQLFEQSCRLMVEGIRNQFPDANESQVQEIFRTRLRRLRQLRDSG